MGNSNGDMSLDSATKNEDMSLDSAAKNEDMSPDSVTKMSGAKMSEYLAIYIEKLDMEPIGRGRDSVVYSGFMTGTERRVTVKEDRRKIEGDIEEGTSSYWEVRRKIDLLREIDHPHIARLVEFIPDWKKNCSYIIMEYIDGRSLQQTVIDKDGALPQAQVLNWACELLDALDYLHGKGYAHGGIRPTNVVIGPDQQHAYLVDFQYVSEDLPEEETQDGSPSARLNFQKYDDNKELRASVAGDFRSLGQTLFYALTGENFKDCEDLRKTLEGHSVTPALADVVLKAMETDSSKGYRSALEMLREIHNLPKIDAEKKRYTYIGYLGAIACITLFLTGAFLYISGQKQAALLAEMRSAAAQSYQFTQEGKYTEAIDSALRAAEWTGPANPPVPAVSQQALAQALDAYNPTASYRPYRSDYPLQGKPLKAVFSPSGRQIAVLVEATGARPAAKRIQIFDAESARELTSPLSASYSDFSECRFLDDNTILYTAPDSLALFSISDGKTISLPQPGGSLGTRNMGLAVSPSGKAACVNWSDGSVYLYDTAAILASGTADKTEFTAHTEFRDWILSGERVDVNQEKLLIALSGDGDYMALSYPDGRVRVYRLDGEAVFAAEDERANYVEFPMDVDVSQGEYLSLEIEGGFCGSVFLYSTTATWLTEAPMSVARAFRLPESAQAENGAEVEELMRLPARSPIHAQADENGLYYSMGQRIGWIDTRQGDIMEGWIADAKDDVLLLRHAGGRLLAVTASKLVLVYRDDGAWKVELTDREQYQIADLSEEYLLLARTDRPVLSVRRWNYQRNVTQTLLTYNVSETTEYPPEEGEEGPIIVTDSDYDRRYVHTGAHIHSKGDTAMLYRDDGFRVYRLDSEGEPGEIIREVTFSDAGTPVLAYLRNPNGENEPDTECLKAVFDDVTRYYAADTGEELEGPFPQQSKADALVFRTKDYIVRQNGGVIEALKAKSGQRIWQSGEGELRFASQTDRSLILSFVNESEGDYSVLLNRSGQEIAKIPAPCEAMPDGWLVFDDEQGHLLTGKLYALDELINLAKGWKRDGTT